MKKTILNLSIILVAGIGFVFSAFYGEAESRSDLGANDPLQKKAVTVRTETFPRPPYSGATYYIYESDNKVVCTKLEVCNKFNNCTTTYKKGTFKDEPDVETGEPYGKTDAVVIAASKLKKHSCLTKFRLLP